MNQLVTKISEAASSLRLCGLLFALWCVGIWSSPFYIAPSSDDGTLISIALGVMQFGSVSMLYIDQPAIYSAAFPTYGFLTGIFYQVWDAIGLPINYYVYNAFNNLTATLALIALVSLLFQTAANWREGALRANFSLTLLAITPYIIDIAHLRMEPLGLAATIGAILAFHRAGIARGSGIGLYIASALLLGLAVSLHPSLLVCSGLTALAALVILLRRGMIKTGLTAIFAGLVTPMLVIGWYLANLPQSVDMLFFEVNERASTLLGIGDSLRNILEYILLNRLGGASFEIRAYNAILFSILALSIGAALIMLFMLFRTKSQKFSDADMLCAAFFFGALFNTTIDPSGKTQLYVVMSGASVLMVGMLARLNVAGINVLEKTNHRWDTALAGIIVSAMVLAVLFNPIVHISKRLIYSNQRYHGLTANALVRPHISKGDALFFTTGQFLPPFVDLVNDTYGGNADIEAYLVLPYMHGRPDLERHAVSALACYLARRQGERIVWGVSRKLLKFDKGAPRRATIRLVTRFRYYRIEFEVAKILYEFHNGYYIAGRVLSLTEFVDIMEDTTNKAYFIYPDKAPGCLDQAALKDDAG